jgi:hypothetical protein
MIYAYKCLACGVTEDRDVPIAECNTQLCQCGVKLEQDWANKTIQTIKGYVGYYDTQLGRYIESPYERQKAEKELGLYATSPNEVHSIKPKKKVIDERKIRKCVENAVNQIDNGKRADV